MLNEIDSTVYGLSGEITVSNQLVVRLDAKKLSNSDSTNITINILSLNLYNDNKQECDRNIEAFKIHAQNL